MSTSILGTWNVQWYNIRFILIEIINMDSRRLEWNIRGGFGSALTAIPCKSVNIIQMTNQILEPQAMLRLLFVVVFILSIGAQVIFENICG